MDVVVDARYTGPEGGAAGGSRTFRRVAAAIAEAPPDALRPYVVSIRNGAYYEKLTLSRPDLKLVGESREGTILTFDAAAGAHRADGRPYGTAGSASVTVCAPRVTLENLTVANGFDYPAHAHTSSEDPARVSGRQAVALKTSAGSDRALFRNVRFTGYQDTLFVDVGRHYFSRCEISGHIDFIFGAGRAVFEECDIVSRDRSSPTDNGYITAASTLRSSPYGLLFTGCRLKKEHPQLADASVMLGRPWHPTTDLPDGTRAADPEAMGWVVFMQCYMEAHISAAGWTRMHGRDRNGETVWFNPEEARFYEYRNTGPGAISSPSRRRLSDLEAQALTVAQVLDGWNP